MSRLFIALILLLLSVAPVSATHLPPSCGTVQNNNVTTNDPFSFSYTAGTGDNLAIYALIGWELSGGTVVTVKQGTTGFTQVGNRAVFTDQQAEIWRLLAPASGAQTIEVDFSGAPTRGNVTMITCDNVDQTTPENTPNDATGTGATASVTATTATGELVIDVVAADQAGTVLTVGADQTQLANVVVSNDNLETASSHQAGANGGVMSWGTGGGSVRWRILAVSLKPAADPAVPAVRRPPVVIE